MNDEERLLSERLRAAADRIGIPDSALGGRRRVRARREGQAQIGVM